MATPSPSLTSIKALFFDVFGTVVDWRSTVTRSLHHSATTALSASSIYHTIPSPVRSKASSLQLSDWADFAAAWRATYYAFTRSVATSANPGAPYKTVDEHHYDSLLDLLEEWGLHGLWSADEVKKMSLVWHRLNPWRDSCEGIRRLNKKFTTCTLSNGNVGLLQDMAEYAGLEWTEVLSSEMFKSYKPNPAVYLGAARAFGLWPEECCMVAAHLSDLEAAKGCGFRTVYVERSREEAWDAEKVAQTKKEGWVDVWVNEDENGFLTVAERLGMD